MPGGFRALLSLPRRFAIALANALPVLTIAAAEPATAPVTLEARTFRVQFSPGDGRTEISDTRAGVVWRSNPLRPRFGDVVLQVDGQPRRVVLDHGTAVRTGDTLEITFHPLTNRPQATLRARLRISGAGESEGLECSYTADPALKIEGIRLLDDLFWVTDVEKGYAVVPVREGLLIPADSGLTFTHRFDTYNYEGCHLAMFGLVKDGAAMLVSWRDPYVAADVTSVRTNALSGAPTGARQLLAASLALRATASSFRVQFLGRGDYNAIAHAYRPVAAEAGWQVSWRDKLAGHPERARLFGASNFKLWSALDREMNDESTREERVQVNWTFAEAAQIAEHLKNDLQLEKVLFLMGGWIHRGYDNQHPDILPAAPECGGNAALANCARRVRRLGYVFGLHDNYQDMYRDAPSWNESFIQKTADGRLAKGGKWAGGRAYLTCSKQALALAQRPQNLPAVKELTGADAYFIDTTYAAGLQECFDPAHPLRRADDLHWKQAISDYARGVFGIFGSECGREWALPHSDFFEGLTGVSGRHYHDAGLEKKLGATVVPLFEMVYRDGIAAYGKYGYDPAQAAAYVLHHVIIGRPLHYHSIPPHLYWQQPSALTEPLRVRPAVADVKQTGPREFQIAYRWTVDQTPASDWRVFVHFTDEPGKIRFQNDHEPTPTVAQWAPGEVRLGPFAVTVPEGTTGTFAVRIGLFQPKTGLRAALPGADPEERSCHVGQLRVSTATIAFEPATATATAPTAGTRSDPGVFTRGNHGWTAGLHPLDRFLKNTHEILSPLHELTAQTPMTHHEFLTPDRLVQRSVFGQGATATEVIINLGPEDYRHAARLGGDVNLPPFGFLVESPDFVAFHARSWGGRRYETPALFTLRSLDGRPLGQSQRVRVYHAFGDARIDRGGITETVDREGILTK